VAQGLAALLACETVSGFLEQLGFDAPGSPDHPLRRGTLGAPLFDRASASRADSMAGLDAARIAAQFGADWAEAYPALVDANLASARGMRFEDATYREIEGLLALLSSRARDSVP
jgi:hypothetical protein